MAGYLEEQEWLKTVSPSPTSFRTTAHENKTFSIQHHFQVQEPILGIWADFCFFRVAYLV